MFLQSSREHGYGLGHRQDQRIVGHLLKHSVLKGEDV